MMCGIFGTVALPNSNFDVEQLDDLVNHLFLLSESRGKDSAGLVLMDESQITIYKRPERARHMVRQAHYKQLVSTFQEENASLEQPVVIMGHARMVTNGKKEYHGNNQPVIKDGLVCIHNGIIVNDERLWHQHQELERIYQVDTEVLLALIRNHVRQGKTFAEAVTCAMQTTQGANSIALVADDRDGLVLATSNGSLYFSLSADKTILVFASEEYILKQTIGHASLSEQFNQSTVIKQLQPCEGMVFDFASLQATPLFLHQAHQATTEHLPLRPQRTVTDVVDDATEFFQDDLIATNTSTVYSQNDDFIHQVNAVVESLKRCSRCILPETFPFIEFNNEGVCNYCQHYRPINFKGEDALKSLLEPYRRSDNKPDILVPLSGGRDSSYAIHYIKNVLDMNPVAYTYDWGLVTDLARRNISRMCGALGIEHILISADIKTKRENVRKNVQAWLKKPALGTIPLFMAGDKQFFYYSNMLKQQMDIDVVLYGMNPLERTDFKVGFTGINEIGRKQEKHYALSSLDSIRMAGYYGWHFLTNPAYLNSSLLDSFFAFISYYMIPKDYHILYEYLRWDEDSISNLLIDEYDWETATDTESTWRIGDGTASFYNYIYYTVAGFSENDTFRSNQIRENMISREEALAIADRDNQPRYASMRWYAETIGFDFAAAIKRINAMPKLYQV